MLRRDPSFSDRFGPWAVVAGAAEGIGAAFAEELAARAFNLLLLDQKVEPLEESARGLRARHGAQVRTAEVDLGAPDVVEVVDAAAADLEVGLLVYNACHSTVGEFLATSVESKLTTVDVNCRGPVLLCSSFGERMVARGRGGIVLMSSLSSIQGTAMVGTYAATKAFNTILGESLWSELGPRGVEVQVCMAGATNTPGFLSQTPVDRRHLARPMEPRQVAVGSLDALARRGHKGPTFVPGALNRAVAVVAGRVLPRWAAVRLISSTTRKMYSSSG